MEHDYNDLQEEVNEKTKLLTQLRKRYKGALAEIQDLESEHLNEKAELLDTIRTLEIDFGFYKSVVDMLLNEGNLYKIKAKSQYDDEKSEWVIPPFVLKGNQINLPKLGLQKAMRFVEEEKNNQIVDFKTANNSYLNENSSQEKHTSKSVSYSRSSKKGDKFSNNKQNKIQLKHNNISAPNSK